MIYFITFVLTLLLSYIARATPACGDVATPKELYDPTYADAQTAEDPTLVVYNVTWSNYYDNPYGNTKKVVCNSLARRYPYFENFPDFPFIGGAFNIKKGSQNNCSECWRLTYPPGSRMAIYITAINSDTSEAFNISKTAYNILTGASGSQTVLASATPVPPRLCERRRGEETLRA
jgi:hypothetical protein